MEYPKKILHWFSDSETDLGKEKFFSKYNPADGGKLADVIEAEKEDVEKFVKSASESYGVWRKISIVGRADVLRKAAFLISENKKDLAEIVALESGKPVRNALGEITAAAECGFFIAGEGRRNYGKVLMSAAANREVKMVRQSIGVGALIVPFNNPMASIAWKTFPALLCGNSVILKSHPDTPYSAIAFAKILKEAGVPAGVFSVIQGGAEAGAALAEHKKINFISFTGSSESAISVLKASATRMAKVSVESGGKNPFIVCEDADLQRAASLASESAFIDAGQRCAAASRIIILEPVYEEFKKIFLEKVAALKVGVSENDDLGAIINEKRLNWILGEAEAAVKRGGKLIFGTGRLSESGYFLTPMILEDVPPSDEISDKEIFGPVVILYRAKDFKEAIYLANLSKYKLSGAIHTKDMGRAQEFIKEYNGGVVRVNGPTHGSEPHMPFGGTGFSGNGWREPGEAALDFYSDWKQISIDY
ncbi:MAG: aldehyde dehydrogenase family protein [Patescibacteria group bacterium]